MSYPSINTLMSALRIERDVATKIRKVMDGTMDPCEASEKTRQWADRCFHRPRTHELEMHAIDALLGHHGVEFLALPSDGYTCPANIRGDYRYSNAGDAYACTVIRDCVRGRWLVCSWASLAERETALTGE